MKRIAMAVAALTVSGLSTLAVAQGVTGGSSSAAVALANVSLNSLGSVTLFGLPASGFAPMPYDRFGPTQDLNLTLMGQGGVAAQDVHVRVTSNVDGRAGSRFAYAAAVTGTFMVKVGTFSFTANAITTATRVTGGGGSLNAQTTVRFENASVNLGANSVALNSTYLPNFHLMNDKGISVTLNEQSTSGDGTSSKGRIASAVHIRLLNVPVNLGTLNGDIYIGRTFAQLKAQ